MRKVLPLILCSVVLITSCDKKTRNVHFYGRAWVECDGTPVVNGTVTINIKYDPGTSQSDEVASTSTDGNGDYSIITDVTYDGSFDTYTVTLTSEKNFAFGIPTSGNSGSSRKVHCDLPASVPSYAHLHIKNALPVNSNDHFVSLYFSPDSNNFINSQPLHLWGTDVDTTIVRSFSPGREYYKYYYNKNGIYSYSPVFFFDVECKTDVNVEVPY